MARKRKGLPLGEDTDRNSFPVKCPQCGKQFIEEGRRLKERKPLRCTGCNHSFSLSYEEVLAVMSAEVGHRVKLGLIKRRD